jgi:hypothetical protein
MLKMLPTLPMLRIEPELPMLRIEPALPMDRIDPALPMLRTLPKLRTLPTLQKLRMLNRLLALSGPAKPFVLIGARPRLRLERMDLPMIHSPVLVEPSAESLTALPTVSCAADSGGFTHA